MNGLEDRIRRLRPLPSALWIDGREVPGGAGSVMEVRDPATGALLTTVPRGTATDVDAAVMAARRAFASFRLTAAADRGRLLMRIAALLREEARDFAEVETLQTGKPLNESLGDVTGAATLIEYYAGAADKVQGDTIPGPAGTVIFTLVEPVGVTGHIVPWNFPLGTAIRGFAPAVATGNTIVLKPAEQTPLTVLMFARLLARAGLPAGVFNVVTGLGAEVGAAMSAHPGIAHMTFTGSVGAGQAVMKGAADHIGSVTLELGGKSPIIVLDDADTDRAVAGVVKGIFRNAGQVCSAGSRLVVMRSRFDEVVGRVIDANRAMTFGHGLDDPSFGPLISSVQAGRVAGFVERAAREGSEILSGGHAVEVQGLPLGRFYAPTLVTAVSPAAEIVREEVFGPVLTVQAVADPEEAFTTAAASRYGLCAGVFTRDIGRALTIARDLEVGQVWINDYFVGGPETPFGGVKDSGFGRERGLVALQNYCRVKSVAIRL